MKQSLLNSSLSLGFVLCVGLGCGLGEKTSRPNSAGPTEADVKQFITRKEEASATGHGGQAGSVTLTFQNIRFGASREADRRDRLVNGITGSTVYPVRVKYTAHRTWPGGSQDQTIHRDYEFFQDQNGEWDSYLVGVVN
jgi:hypothetical protein